MPTHVCSGCYINQSFCYTQLGYAQKESTQISARWEACVLTKTISVETERVEHEKTRNTSVETKAQAYVAIWLVLDDENR
ncbi:hypothetical protein ACTXT7_010367 [Hymenolepis weldensis]